MMNSKMMASGGAAKSKMMASGGAAKSKMMASGDMPEALKKHAGKPASKAHAGLKAGGMAKKGYASGGSVKKGIDGIAKQGHTKGTEIVMKARGGKVC
jgi:hypothetical protein